MRVQTMSEIAANSQLTDVQCVLNANALTGVKLPLKEALMLLPYVENHKWYVSERLDRDVGMYVAAVDYFENIYAPRGTSSRPGALVRGLRSLAKHLTAELLPGRSRASGVTS